MLKRSDHIFASRIKCYQGELLHPQDKADALELVNTYTIIADKLDYNSRQAWLAGQIKGPDSYFMNETRKQN